MSESETPWFDYDNFDDHDSIEWLSPGNFPEDAFRASHAELGGLKLSDDGSNLMNRMVFAHYIAALEAYLADAAIQEVLAHPEAMKRLPAQLILILLTNGNDDRAARRL
jgi:FMN phosphatase YigB (HAD superfamily)